MLIEQYILLTIIATIIEGTTTETIINQEEVDISNNLLEDIKEVEETTLVEAATTMIAGEAVTPQTQEDGIIMMVIGTREEAIRVTGREGITRKMIDGIMEVEAGITTVNV